MAFNPFDGFSDEALYQAQLALSLACGRAKSVLKERHRTYLCSLRSIADLEANHRGKPSPQPPYKA